jgi:hypothetical protein
MKIIKICDDLFNFQNQCSSIILTTKIFYKLIFGIVIAIVIDIVP